MSRPSDAEPRSFSKYQILGRVAVGGMAEIFKARLEGEGGFNRTFAVKRILPHLSSRPEFVEMLVEEAKIAGLLSHANIVQIMDLGEVDGTYYIAMEYVDGPDLGRILRRCRDKGITLPVPHAVFLVIEVLKGLEYAHNRRVLRGGKEMPLDIVHRDISPANVLVSFQGEVKLTDFGIAKASVKALETVSGIIKGRFDYLAPEQAAGHSPDCRADLFAAGVLLYECLTGRHPFRQRTEAATIDAIREGRYPSPSQVNPDVPFPLEHVLERALAVDPADRYASATQMKEALDRFFHDAGFIFSHSTLAAFLKGLFPEEAASSARGGLAAPVVVAEEDEKTRQHSVSDQDRPTRVDLPSRAAPQRSQQHPQQHSPPHLPQPTPVQADPFARSDSTVRKPRPSALAAAPDMPFLPDGPPEAGFGEEATLIRPSPVAQAPRLPDPAEAWGEAETVIRPDPGAQVQQQRNQAAIDAALPIQDTTIQRAAPEGDTQVQGLRPPTAPPARTSWRVHVLYMALVVVCSVGSLFVGVLLTQWRLAATDTSAAVPQHEPQLRVILPDAARLLVDGRPVPGPSPIDVFLTASQTHRIEVEKDGFTPFSTRLSLEPNDVRVLTIQAESLSPQRR